MNDRVKVDNTQCSGCGMCINVCKRNAIQMKKMEDGFLYPMIDRSSCVECNACVKICPFDENKSKEIAMNFTKDSYLFKHEESIRKKSSSGGFFTLLSDYVLDNGGVIYGAVFDDNFNVMHARADNKIERDKMRGSKYAQSTITASIYQEVLKDLKVGKVVLFTGTPCQCAAIVQLLHKKIPQNLILMDVICHGVMSGHLFQEYLDGIREKNTEHGSIIDVNLRDKELGWQDASVTFLDGYKHHGKDNYFYSIYGMNSLQRSSCFKCVYAQNQRVGDFTVGDFWGVKESYPEMHDELGVSIVLANSERAIAWLEKIKKNEDMIMQEIEPESYERFQPNLKHPTLYGSRAEKFKSYYYKHGYKKTVRRFFVATWRRKINTIIYLILKKLHLK